MRVLIACEFSGIVRDAFIARGHDAVSCDLLPTERPGPHYHGDVRDILDDKWDACIAHPSCQYLTNAGSKWLYNGGLKENGKDEDRWNNLDKAAAFFRLFATADHIPRRVIENPIPNKYALALMGRKYDQIVQPWWFGHKEMKSTCLWFYGVKKLVATDIVGPPPKDKDERKSWQRVHRETPGADRWKNRSRTFSGIAKALAEQVFA